MRILNIFIKKLYHLICFLRFVFMIPILIGFMNTVNAVTTVDGAKFTQPSAVAFADNTGGQLTRIDSTWESLGSYYRSIDSILTTGSNYYGANWAFYSDTPLVQGHTYVLSVLIGMANTYATTNVTSRSRLCIAEDITNAFARYNNYNFPCTTTWAINTNNVASYTDNNLTQFYTLLSYVFTADFTSPALTGSYNSAVSNQSNHTFGGYILEEISSQPLTQSQIQSAVQSSGLATANSVSQVQSSINQIQTDINSSANNIINNNNNNTTNIINNNNQNTDEIINNNNENTDKEIESQKVCKNNRIDINSTVQNGLINSAGSVSSTSAWRVTDFLPVSSTSTIKVLQDLPAGFNSYLCFYNSDKSVTSCIENSTLSANSSLTIPSNSSFVRFSIFVSSNLPTFDFYTCSNGNQALNDTLNDSSIDSSDNTINNLKDKIPTNSVISDLLLLPVRFLQNFVNALGSSCTQFNLGSLYGTNLYMPCINIENYLGSGIWTTIDLIISGLFVYALRKKFIEIYENLTNLKNGGNEVD